MHDIIEQLERKREAARAGGGAKRIDYASAKQAKRKADEMAGSEGAASPTGSAASD